MSIKGVDSNIMRQDISRMLEKMREISQSRDTSLDSKAAERVSEKSFDNVLDEVQSVVSKVNEIQANSANLKDAYVSGDTSVSLADVVMAAQKSDLAFQGLVTVRNKLVEAYKDIMNMPI